PSFCRFELYQDAQELRGFEHAIADADAVIVGSYVEDGVVIGRWIQEIARGVTAFYDIDTPVTLATLMRGECKYVSADIIPDYDLYLSFTGGHTLDLLETRYRSPRAAALYCSVDTQAYAPRDTRRLYDLSYIGTYSADRQPTLERLLLEPARRAPDLRFVVAGPQYPADIVWPRNVQRIEHVEPVDHPRFYSASRYTLNVTRRDMIAAGYSPSVRLFEAAACDAPLISDNWEGLEAFFLPGRDIIVAHGSNDVLAKLRDGSDRERNAIAANARARVLDAHTAKHRAAELEAILTQATTGTRLAARIVASV
ncbi:MAG: hypothetical protein JWL62_666, partial [Hyphomicrobiales bacterium]|nr:hypothetical protein [Hyphomicrobiales bacterium]